MQPPDEKKQKKPKKVKVIPKAVLMFRRAANRYPPKSWWPKVVEDVGEDEGRMLFFGYVVFFYCGQGWNPTNVDNMLQFFRKGTVPRHPELDWRNWQDGKPPKRATPGEDGAMDVEIGREKKPVQVNT